MSHQHRREYRVVSREGSLLALGLAFTLGLIAGLTLAIILAVGVFE